MLLKTFNLNTFITELKLAYWEYDMDFYLHHNIIYFIIFLHAFLQFYCLHQKFCYRGLICLILSKEDVFIWLRKHRMCTWQQGVLILVGQEIRECCIFISDVGTRHLFVSGSWYCQIQTTRLIMFFINLSYI